MSSNDPPSEGKPFSPSKKQSAKTCFLEDLEEDMNGERAGVSRKSRRKLEQDVFNRKHNTTTSTNESSISRSHFSASTPNIFSSSTSSTAKIDLEKSTNGNQLNQHLSLYHILAFETYPTNNK